MKREEKDKTMNKKIFFVMVGIFLFFTLLYIPTKAKAGDLMRWEPHTFAGGGYASHGDLLNTAIAIKHGAQAFTPYYYYYYYDSFNTNVDNSNTGNNNFYVGDIEGVETWIDDNRIVENIKP